MRDLKKRSGKQSEQLQQGVDENRASRKRGANESEAIRGRDAHKDTSSSEREARKSAALSEQDVRKSSPSLEQDVHATISDSTETHELQKEAVSLHERSRNRTQKAQQYLLSNIPVVADSSEALRAIDDNRFQEAEAADIAVDIRAREEAARGNLAKGGLPNIAPAPAPVVSDLPEISEAHIPEINGLDLRDTHNARPLSHAGAGESCAAGPNAQGAARLSTNSVEHHARNPHEDVSGMPQSIRTGADRRRRNLSADDEHSDRFSRKSKRYSANSSTPRCGRRTRTVLVALACVIAVVFVIAFVAYPQVASMFGRSSTSTSSSNSQNAVSSTASTDSQTQAEEGLPTPIIAESKGVYIHSAVKAADITEILIHNASYNYAEPLTAKLKEANNEETMKKHGTGRNRDNQPTGDHWLTGQYILSERLGNAGPFMSAIDCGAAVGAQVYAPITGKVLLVKKYKLYDKYEDYIIHIQPEGKPDLDLCIIHLTDPSVQAGQEVTAGVTPIAKVRDVYAYVGDEMDLKLYTVEGDNGNHVHIQLNNVKAKNYHGLDDLKNNGAQNSSSTDVGATS